MSVRVSRSRLLNSACSGLMYSGVPIITPCAVYIVCSVSGWCIALARPKSITFGTGLPSYKHTRMFDGQQEDRLDALRVNGHGGISLWVHPTMRRFRAELSKKISAGGSGSKE